MILRLRGRRSFGEGCFPISVFAGGTNCAVGSLASATGCNAPVVQSASGYQSAIETCSQ
jgi:hypothetical protein